tara:strand:+ start:95 stop:427 length:333 start_codon:yes stop_codon:yes gene_type:complete
MSYKQIDNLIDKINRNGLNRLNLELDRQHRREILNRSKYNWKKNLSFLKEGVDRSIVDLQLQTPSGLKTFRVRPDKSRDWGFFINIELIKVFYCNRIEAEKILEINKPLK